MRQPVNPFSESSYGFRPRRSAHEAVRAAQEYIQGGKDWVVDIDIAQFFDHVNHDILMQRIAEAGRKLEAYHDRIKPTEAEETVQ